MLPIKTLRLKGQAILDASDSPLTSNVGRMDRRKRWQGCNYDHGQRPDSLGRVLSKACQLSARSRTLRQVVIFLTVNLHQQILKRTKLSLRIVEQRVMSFNKLRAVKSVIVAIPGRDSGERDLEENPVSLAPSI